MNGLSVALSGLVFFLFSFTTTAEMKDLGPAVGAMIPHDLKVSDQNGTIQSIENLAGDKGFVLVFYRSADWCPYCQVQLLDLNMHARKEARALGYELVGISYDPVETLKRFTKKWKIGYPLLSDEGSKIIDAFGLRNDERYKPGDRGWGVPHPILVITDKEGVILKKLFREAYSERPEPEVLLEALSGLAD